MSECVRNLGELVNEAKKKYGFYNRKNGCLNKDRYSPVGLYRVRKIKSSNYAQGFCYSYSYYDDDRVRRTFSSVDIVKLKNKVKDHGMKWKVTDKDLVIKNGLCVDDVR